jgi:antirestriction protein ArdC
MRVADLYDSVTRSIIQELEQGAAPWLKPWKNGKTMGTMPTNAATGRGYSGINIPILWHAADAGNHPTHGWMTYRQAQQLQAQVRKGEKGTTVVFTRRLNLKEDEEEKTISMLRTYTVFNVAQMDGLPPAKAPEPRQIPPFIAATKADIRPGPQPMYVPAKDFIAMPPQADFRDEAHHTATALHELAHWSGAKHRLDRDMEGRFGTRKYAAEELVAELTSAFLCAHLGIKGELRHAGYIETWLELLRSDNRAMFTAASKASQAADYLRAFSETPENE